LAYSHFTASSKALLVIVAQVDGLTSILFSASKQAVLKLLKFFPWNVGDIKGSKAMKQAYEMGKLA
ncbi:hypothetical protein ACTPEM_24020, partial [Clostridioides difficile]